MPIYEYRCTSCGNTLETMQKVSDPAPASCPACAAEGTMERLVSRTSFQLKGGGWYSDLYASTKKEPQGGGAEAKSADAKGAGAKEAAAKPAAAPAGGSATSGSTPSASPSTPASSAGGKGGGSTP